MSKNGRPAALDVDRSTVHPRWCLCNYDGSDDNHDPHLSARERIDEDFPSDLVIDAYLSQTRTPTPAHRDLANAVIEFRFPGEETASYLMTFGQLRRLSEALCRLVSHGELFIFPTHR